MKWVAVIGITMLVAAIVRLDWPKYHHLPKERTAFAALLIAGYVLAVVLVVFPTLPGPTQMLSVIYKPLARIMEK